MNRRVLACKKSMTFKLVAMFFILSVTTLLLLVVIIKDSTSKHFYNYDFQHLTEKYNSIKPQIEKEVVNSNLLESSIHLWKLNTNGEVASTNSKIALPEFLEEGVLHEWSIEKDRYRALRFTPIEGSNYYIILGVKINQHYEFISKLNTILTWSILFISIITGICSVIIVESGLSPISILRKNLLAVSTTKLDSRVPIEKLPVEIIDLAHTQNEMLDRLQAGFSQLSEFASDIAHELRTPLTNIMTQAQVSLSAPRSVHEHKEILASIIEELERINKTINDTLYLAKSENKILGIEKETLDLKEIIQPLIEYYEIPAEEKSVEILLTGSASQIGDKTMIQRAVGNILSNALRHCYENTTIDITINSSERHNSITIKNTGDPIPEDSIPYLFNRFYRADKSRQHSFSTGAGLGLAIAKSIVTAHSGDISVSSNDGITKVCLEFPNRSIRPAQEGRKK